MKLSLFCKCGDAMVGTVGPGTEAAAHVESVFRDAHRGPTCGKATKAEAAKARRKRDREDRS